MSTEKRMIDANELYAKLGKMSREPYYQHDGEDYYVGIADAAGAVYEAPIIDAVEVVRCKKCKYFFEGEPYDPCECMKWKTRFSVTYTTPDGFCHKGERKDNA